MVFVVSSRTAIASLLLLSVAQPFVEAHTWLDCLDTDRSKLYDQSASYIFGGAAGNGFCGGYGAGYPGRGDTDIGTGYTYKLLKNEVEAGAPVCEDVGSNTYTDWRKRLSVAPGQTAYFAYLPNGHIVKDKKGVGTQHGVYWTGQVGTSLSSTHDMKPENLVDGKTMDYDDGNCGETYDYNGNPSHRAGDGKPCIGSFVVPAGTAPGIYNMVWYWTFWLDNQGAYKDQDMAKGYFGAAYSTCFELEVTSGGNNSSTTEQQQQQQQQQQTSYGTPAPLGTTAPPMETQPLVAAEAAPMANIPPPASTPGATPAPTPPIVAAPAPETQSAPAATPVLTAQEVTPAPTTPAPAATPAPTTPVPAATPAPTTPVPAATPASEVAPAPTTSTPAENNSPPASGSTGSVCRRRMRS